MEENNNLEENLAQVENTEQEEQHETEQTETNEQQQPEKKEENPAAENFKRLREKSERAERERDEAVRILKEMYAKQEKISDSDDEDFKINDDDLVEGKHLSKFQKKIKKLEQQVHNYEQVSDQLRTETRLKSQYADFDKVVNQENIEVLREKYPELADSIANSSNLYNKAVSAYTLIKRLGIAVEDNYSQDRELAQKNSSKPRPLSSVAPQQGDSPLSRANAFANGLTDELKAQLRKEMEEARKYR